MFSALDKVQNMMLIFFIVYNSVIFLSCYTYCGLTNLTFFACLFDKSGSNRRSKSLAAYYSSKMDNFCILMFKFIIFCWIMQVMQSYTARLECLLSWELPEGTGTFCIKLWKILMFMQ